MQIDLWIDDEIRSALPELALGVIEAQVRVTQHDPVLWKRIDERTRELQSSLEVESIPEIPQVAALRKAYRTLGKDPTRYRGSQEALLRRILKGKGLYRINTVVDINNLLSIETFHSICLFDVSRLEPPVVFRKAAPRETYQGIGRDVLNVAGLPVFADQQSAFGSPTSDSERTKITLETQYLLMIIVSFTGTPGLEEHCGRVAELLCAHAEADPGQVQTRIETGC